MLTVAADLIVEAVTEPVRFLRYAHRELTTFTYPWTPLLTTFTNLRALLLYSVGGMDVGVRRYMHIGSTILVDACITYSACSP